MVAAAQASRQMVRYFHEKLPSVRSRHPWQTEGRMVQTALSVGRGRQEAALGKKQLSVTSPSPTSTPKVLLLQHPEEHEELPRQLLSMGKSPKGETPTLCKWWILLSPASGNTQACFSSFSIQLLVIMQKACGSYRSLEEIH